MTSLFLSPRGHDLSHTKSEAVKVTRTNTKYKFHMRENTPVRLLNILNILILMRHLELKCYFWGHYVDAFNPVLSFRKMWVWINTIDMYITSPTYCKFPQRCKSQIICMLALLFCPREKLLYLGNITVLMHKGTQFCVCLHAIPVSLNLLKVTDRLHNDLWQ